jgi:hypothetical protein
VSDGVLNVKSPYPAIQIHIAELRGNVLNTHYNLLDTIYSNTREFAIDPENVLFQPLGETVLNFLSVTFTDRQSFPVQPIENSYLQFTLKNMSVSEPKVVPIYATLTATYPGSEVGFRLPRVIHLEQKGTWQLAISSVILPNTAVTIEDSFGLTVERDGESTSVAIVKNSIQSSYPLKQVAAQLQRKIARQMEDSKPNKLQITVDRSGRFTFLSLVPCRITLSNIMAWALGIQENGYDNAGLSLDLVPDMGKRSEGRANFNFIPHSGVFVECSNIEPSVHNNEFRNILRILPVDFSSTAENVWHQFKHLEFHDLTHSTLSELRFRFTNGRGEDIDFSEIENNSLIPMNFLLRQNE